MAIFNKDFLVGSATAAFQVEGNNINSDTWVEEQLPHSGYEERSFDAVDHYNHYEEDIKLMADAGLNAYRFSLEWARIQPTPDTWDYNEINHYKKVLECCHANGIKPIVTLFHFTSPKWLITLGGWENPKVIYYFTEYCKKVISELGDLMEYVCTMNEANMRMQIAEILKEIGVLAQKEGNLQIGLNLQNNDFDLGEKEKAEAFGIQWPEKAYPFVSPCTDAGDKIVMLAHQAAKKAILEINPNLKVGLTLTVHDVQSVEGGEKFAEKEWIDEFSHYLPYIKDDEFLGVQCYTRNRFDANGKMPPEEGVPLTQMGYEEYPDAVVNVVRRIAKEFKNDLIITENGIGTDNDETRIEFIKRATDGIAKCIEDGIPVKGYMYWSTFDNYEWQKGFSMTFGVVGVDRSTQTRHPKESLYFLGSLLEK